MPLATGDRLGPYVILGPIGAGGMGEVYRARDTKLDREVAIKVLPAALAQHPDRLARFEREAKVLAALNHPNIAMIHGLEDRAIVMELVEGATLAERLRTGPIPLEESLKIAAQIADALEAAHERGIVHRDLKPANIKVRDDGTVKVLDFGLATAVQSGAGQAAEGANSPTLTMGATEAGVILGTAAYMSPEQAAGKPVDRRADIWSFGVVLWEMLTSKRLFEGETVSHTLADVLKGEINFGNLPKGTPAPIRELLRRCLDRDIRTRLQWIGEARVAIQKWLANPSSEMVITTPSRSPSQSALFWQATAVVLGLAFVAVSWMVYRAKGPPQPKPLVRLDVDLGPDVSLGSTRGANVIISPDGTRLVYAFGGGPLDEVRSNRKLVTRKLNQPTATELEGTDGAFAPFFSPDSQWVAFFAGGKLKKVSMEGGAPVVLCDALNPYGGSWSEDGTIVASLTGQGPLYRIPSTGGTPTPVTEFAAGEIAHRWPQALAEGNAVLFTSSTSLTSNGANIEVATLKDRRRKTLVRGGMFGRYLSTSNRAGYLVYINNGTLFAAPFDLSALEVRGTPVPMLDKVAYNPAFGSAQLDFSQTGMVVYRSGAASASRLVTVQWLSPDGKTEPLLAKPGPYLRPRLSPDGQRLAVEIPNGSTRDIWIYDWHRDTMTRLTFDAGGGSLAPVWTPDGRYIVFGGNQGMFWTRSDGAGKPQPLTHSKYLQDPVSFMPDGKRLAWNELTAGGRYNSWTMALESDSTGLRAGKPELFLQSSFDERVPMFSRDGRWLAYTSNESGDYQVYVRAFPDKGGKWQISYGGGSYPVWSRNGRELFFRSPDNHIMVAAYMVNGDSFVADQPRVWSQTRIADFGIIGTWSYDLSPDGKRIVALMPVETLEAQQAQNHVVFLENFFDELRRRVPVGK